MGEFPWARAASEAARLLRGGDPSRPPFGAASESPFTLQRSDSNRTDVSTLYETPAFRRSSLPRLDSYRGKDNNYGSLDAKLSEYLGRPSADSELPKYTSRNGLETLPEKSNSEEYLQGYQAPPSQTAQLIDFDDEDPAPLQLPKQPSELVSEEFQTEAFKSPSLVGPDSSVKSYLVAETDALNPYATASRHLSSSGDYLNDAKEDNELYGDLPKSSADGVESDEDDDFMDLMKPQSSASLLARAQDIQTPVNEEEIDYSAAPEENLDPEEVEQKAEEGTEDADAPVANEDDDEAIDAMLKALQAEIDEEERQDARAKREARRKALASSRAAAEASEADPADGIETADGEVRSDEPVVTADGSQGEDILVKESSEEISKEDISEKAGADIVESAEDDQTTTEFVPEDSGDLQTPEEYERTTDAHADEYEDIKDSDLNLKQTNFYSRAVDTPDHESRSATISEADDEKEDEIVSLSEAQAIRTFGSYDDTTTETDGRPSDEIELDELKSKLPEPEIVAEEKTVADKNEAETDAMTQELESDAVPAEDAVDSDETSRDYEIVSVPSDTEEQKDQTISLPSQISDEPALANDGQTLDYEPDLIANEWGSVVPDSSLSGGFRYGQYGYEAPPSFTSATKSIAESSNKEAESEPEGVEDVESEISNGTIDHSQTGLDEGNDDEVLAIAADNEEDTTEVTTELDQSIKENEATDPAAEVYISETAEASIEEAEPDTADNGNDEESVKDREQMSNTEEEAEAEIVTDEATSAESPQDATEAAASSETETEESPIESEPVVEEDSTAIENADESVSRSDAEAVSVAESDEVADEEIGAEVSATEDTLSEDKESWAQEYVDELEIDDNDDEGVVPGSEDAVAVDETKVNGSTALDIDETKESETTESEEEVFAEEVSEAVNVSEIDIPEAATTETEAEDVSVNEVKQQKLEEQETDETVEEHIADKSEFSAVGDESSETVDTVLAEQPASSEQPNEKETAEELASADESEILEMPSTAEHRQEDTEEVVVASADSKEEEGSEQE